MQLIYQQNGKIGGFPRITLGSISALEWQLIIFGGMVFLLPVIMLMGENTLWSKNPIEWAFWANAAFSAPHVYATWVRLERKIGEGLIPRLYGAPLYLAVAAVIGLAITGKHYLEVMTAVNVWQSFHYARQVYGVGRFYTDRRQETELGRRLMFWSYHFAMPLFVLGRWSMLYTAWHGKPSDVIIPVHVPDPIMSLFWILAGIGLCLGLIAEFMKLRDPIYNPVCLVNLLVYFAIHWFGFLSIEFYMRGFIAITIYHAVQYLGIVWLNERKERIKAAPLLGLWSGVSPGLSICCFWLVLFVSGFLFEQKILLSLNLFWASVATMLLSAISAHHYAVDTVLWRAKVRTPSQGLVEVHGGRQAIAHI